MDIQIVFTADKIKGRIWWFAVVISVPVFTPEGRRRLGRMVEAEAESRGVTLNGLLTLMNEELPDEYSMSYGGLKGVVSAAKEPSWQTLALLASTIFRGRYTVHDLAAIACGEEPTKKAPGAPTTGNDSPA